MFRYLKSRKHSASRRGMEKNRSQDRGHGSRKLCIEPLEGRLVLSTSYIAHDLVSNQPGVAPLTDPTLLNAWGISLGPTGPTIWVSSNKTGVSELYTGDVNGTPLVKNPGLGEVNVPGGDPTGQVFNSTTDFVVHSGAASGPAVFIFATESGIISGWNPTVPPPAPSTDAQVGYTAPDGAIYKGIALATNGGANFLYATDFHNGKIDVLDKNFHLTPQAAGAFTDPNLPTGYAPFGIAAIGGKLYVTYAQQGPGAVDDLAGPGNGIHRRLQHGRSPSTAARVTRQAQRPVGRRAGDRQFWRFQQPTPCRQFRRRSDQRL